MELRPHEDMDQVEEHLSQNGGYKFNVNKTNQEIDLLNRDVNHLRDENEEEEDDNMSDGSSGSPPDEVYCLDEESQQELELMRQMGLPSCFASSKNELIEHLKHDKKEKVKNGKNEKNLKNVKNVSTEVLLNDIRELSDYYKTVNNELQDDDIEDEEEVRNIGKYWHQRYKLFSLFDKGIKLDHESWYSVTPENIAKHIATRCLKEDPCVIIDAFCGAGGNTIQFAVMSQHTRVIAIDINPDKIQLAYNNAKVYGVEDRIEFIVGDYMTLARQGKLKADVVFLSPQWGGPKYLDEDKFTLDMIKPDGRQVFDVTNDNITPNIAYYLPRNMDEIQLIELPGRGNFVEIVKHMWNTHKKIKAITALFGNLIKFGKRNKYYHYSE